ncbi:HPF/RaiA family ribosome-associated protein [Nocardioides dilutus]
MKVHLHTDQNIVVDAELQARIESNAAEELARFASRLNRVDLHLTRQSAVRQSGAHVRCRAEARPSGLSPVAVTHEASDARAALDGAVAALGSVLSHTLARLADKGKRQSIRHA